MQTVKTCRDYHILSIALLLSLFYSANAFTLTMGKRFSLLCLTYRYMCCLGVDNLLTYLLHVHSQVS